MSARQEGSGAARRGFSFIEVLVATALLVAVLIPIVFVISQSMRTSEVSLDELTASLWASELVEQLECLPWSAGYRRIVFSPHPNPAPDFPEWHGLPPAGMGFGEADPNARPLQPPIDTKEWTVTGYVYWQPPPDDPLLKAHSRLYLSALPVDHTRRIKLYHPVADPTGVTDPNLWQLWARIDWGRTFMGAPRQYRTCELTTLLANPGFNP